ncbi:hypothetical protein DPX16_15693 [Anabarilius grahami]|uniref:Uncharacterized protein n=1 Tax=Anabarilius grahami TaxID=495550 RepID=A0A3N0YT50_ANAGA|nr:hypothetical protein DPX16_15693 [Anabarilius grahami]
MPSAVAGHGGAQRMAPGPPKIFRTQSMQTQTVNPPLFLASPQVACSLPYLDETLHMPREQTNHGPDLH